MISLREPRSFVWLRIISVIVIITFVTTQFDIRLAFAYPVSTVPGVDTSASKENLKDKLGKDDLFGNVRYSEDLTNRVPDTTQPQVPVQQFQLPQSTLPPPETMTDFIQKDRPLLNITGETVCERNEDQTVETCVAPNQQNPDCLVEGAQCAYYKVDLVNNNRILEIGDFTNPGNPNQLEIRTFHYDDTAGTIQIVTQGISETDLDTFQTYSVVAGTYNPDKLLSSGIVVQDGSNDVFVTLREYDWDNQELTIHDPTSGADQVWQLTESGTGWLLAYEGLYDHDNNAATPSLEINVEFQYEADRMTYYDHANDTFVIQSLEGEFIASGILVDDGQGGVMTKILQEADGDTYRFYSASDPNYLQVVEKLPEGGVGRLLEYQGPDPNDANATIHIGYLYDDDASVLTYLDYTSGIFYRATLEAGEDSGLIDRAGEFIEYGTFAIVNGNKEFKVTLKRVGDVYQILDPDHSEYLTEYEVLPSGDFGRLLRSRGPPQDDQSTAALDDYSLVYDDVEHKVTKFDHINKTISIYQLNPDGETFEELLSSGFFNDIRKTYSLQGTSESSAKWYNYGADNLILTADDQEVPAPVISTPPSSGTSSSSFSRSRFSGGGGDPSLDEKIKRLKRMIKSFIDCVTEPEEEQDRCEQIKKGIESLQRELENASLSGAGQADESGFGFGEGVLTPDLNYHNPPVPPEALLPDQLGLGSAPIDQPGAVVSYNYMDDGITLDGSAWIEVDGKRQLWWSGGDGELGTGDDELAELRETNAQGETIRWIYDRATGRPQEAYNLGTESNPKNELIARYSYNDTTKTLTIEQTNGSMFTYRYDDPSNPFDSPELTSATFKDEVGDLIRQTYDNGKVTSSFNVTKNELTKYDYDLANNTVKITQPDSSTRVVNMGGDSKFGTGDDFLIGGSDLDPQALYTQFGAPPQTSVTDGTVTTFNEKGERITHTYEGGVLVSSQNEETRQTIRYSFNSQTNQATVTLSDGRTAAIDMGADHLFGTQDDRLVGGNVLTPQSIFAKFGVPPQAPVMDGTVTTTNANGDQITHTYQNGQLISSTNETTGETISYQFNLANNQATLTFSDGRTAIINLGADGQYGTQDDSIVSGDFTNIQQLFQLFGSTP
ncbi:MAG: RHS repeat protein, partial [Candidatus Omnitrophica bacterium]|nr:RHS repeat protein [Candidatus Omnitrophota bacterium]